MDERGSLSGWALLAGYAGVLALILPVVGVVAAPVAIVTALAAWYDLNQHPEWTGRGRMLLGLIGGVAGLIVHGFLALALFTNLLD